MFSRVLTCILAALLISAVLSPPRAAAQDDRSAALSREIAGKGWVIYGAYGVGGTWDLFASRPDGSQKRNLTQSPDFEEAGPRVSPDGAKMLYRRMAKGSIIDHDKWGFQGELLLSNLDASNPVALGKDGELPWASWSPDGTQLACLTKEGINIVDLASKQVLSKMPRQGIYQQLYWSPDGKWFCGTANQGGLAWTTVRINIESGELNVVRTFQNCTPDWCPDSNHIILSSRPKGQPGNNNQGYTQLWMVSGDGKEQQLVYGEDGFHIYGGQLSPDGQYVLFTKAPKDGSGAKTGGAPMGIMRMADIPTIGGASPDLRALHPTSKDGPVVTLEAGWEPFWTYAPLGGVK